VQEREAFRIFALTFFVQKTSDTEEEKIDPFSIHFDPKERRKKLKKKRENREERTENREICIITIGVYIVLFGEQKILLLFWGIYSVKIQECDVSWVSWGWRGKK
jgi:hypothetical protein